MQTVVLQRFVQVSGRAKYKQWFYKRLVQVLLSDLLASSCFFFLHMLVQVSERSRFNWYFYTLLFRFLSVQITNGGFTNGLFRFLSVPSANNVFTKACSGF